MSSIATHFPDFDRGSLSAYEVDRWRERNAEYQRLHVLHDRDTVKPPKWWTDRGR